EQLPRDLGVPCGARSLIGDLTVPGEAEPGQAISDRRDRLGSRSCPVGVLDAQPKDAAVMPRKKPVEERRPSAADVQKPSGRGSKTDGDGHSRRMGSDQGDINDRAAGGRETSPASE